MSTRAFFSVLLVLPGLLLAGAAVETAIFTHDDLDRTVAGQLYFIGVRVLPDRHAVDISSSPDPRFASPLALNPLQHAWLSHMPFDTGILLQPSLLTSLYRQFCLTCLPVAPVSLPTVLCGPRP